MQENDTSRRRKFYDQMSEAYDLGSYEEFDSKMNNADSRKKLYDFIEKDGKYDIGDFDYFDKAMQPVVQEEPSVIGDGQPTNAIGNQLDHNGQPYSQAVLDRYNSPDNVAPNFKDLSQIAKEVEREQMGPTDPALAEGAKIGAGVGMIAQTQQQPQQENPFSAENPSMMQPEQQQMPLMFKDRIVQQSQEKNLNQQWVKNKAEAEAIPAKTDVDFGERMAALEQAGDIEGARLLNRNAFDQQNFNKFYEGHVAPVFGEERQKGEQRTREAVKDIPRYDVPGAQSGFARMFESSVAEAKNTDPEKIANATLKRVQDDSTEGGFGDYVLSRMGINDGNDDGGDSPQLSEREKEWMKKLFSKETEEVADKIISRIYDTYKQENTPKNVLDYITGKAFHENMAASLYSAMVRRAAGSSGVREQLRAMASEEFGRDQSWLTRMAGGAAPFAVDMIAGGFALPNLVGSAVTKGGAKLAAHEVTKQLERRAVASGLKNEALKEAVKGGEEVAERYLATQAPVLNLALRAAGSAANFATYDVQSEIINQIANGEFKPFDLMKTATHGAVLGGTMGAAGGAIGHAARNASRIGKIAAGIGGLGAETTIFGISNGLQKAYNEGLDVEDVDWADTAGEAFGQVVGMKTVGAVMHPREFLNRYRKSKDYDLQLNQRDLDNLKSAGYDFDGIFKGLGKFGETAPMEANVINKAKEYIPGPEGTGSKKNTTTEEAWVDADTYRDMLNDPRISSSTKRKIVYVATGKLLMPEPVFGVNMNVDDNGKATVTTTNAYGDVIETKDYSSEEKARKDFDTLQGVSRINTIDGLENIAQRAGTPEIVDAAKGRTLQETGEDVDKALSGEMEDREQAANVLDNYVKNLQEAYMERFNDKLKKIGEAAQANGEDNGPKIPSSGTGGGGSVPGSGETGTGEAGGQMADRTERRDAAYTRGVAIAENEADMTAIGQDERLATARLMQQMPDNDPQALRIRNSIMQAVMDGNDEEADRIMANAINNAQLNPQQVEAIEQWRDAMETQLGVEDAVTNQTEQYELQRRAELEAIADPQGNITQLQLKDGSTVYYKSGDLDNHFGGVFAVDGNGETVQVPVRDIANISTPAFMEDVLFNEVEQYAASQAEWYNRLKNYDVLSTGQQVDMVVSGQPFSAVVAGIDQAGNVIFQMEDGSQMPMNPKDAQQAIMEADNLRIQQTLQAEAESARLAEQQQRFTNGITGFAEGQPDLTAATTDPKTAAEYISTHFGVGGTDSEKDRKQYMTDIQNTKDQLARRHEDAQKELDRLSQWLAGNEDIAEPEEVAQARQQITDLDASIKDIVARQQQWGEIRRQLMTQDELNALEQQRRKDVFKARNGYQPQLPQREISTSDDRITLEDGKPNFGLTSVANANNYLLRNFPTSTDAEKFINEQRLALRNRQRDEVQPEINRRNDLLNAYISGHQELTPDEVTQLVHEIADFEAMQDMLSKEAVRLREISEGIQTLYERNGREEQLTPAEQRGKELDKASSREDKLSRARNIYKEYPEALDAINDQEPRDIAEYISQNLGLKSINWEGYDRGEHHVRGLQEELGSGFERGIGKGYSTNVFNMYLAPEGEGKGIEEIVHDLYEAQPDLEDGKQYSTEDLRNGIIDLLTTAQRPSDISHRVIDNRIAEAEAIVQRQEDMDREAEEEAKYQELQEWAEAYHLNPEEVEAYQDYLAEKPWEFDEEVINQIIADNESDQRSKEVDSQHPDGSVGSEGEGGESQVPEISPAEGTAENPTVAGQPGAEGGTGGEALPDNNVPGRAPNGAIEDETKGEDLMHVPFAQRLKAAKGETNINPTEAQKEAGNYKMGHVRFGGYRMSIENPKGSTRSGVDKNGNPWSIEMKDTYGYILRKIGVDGDHLDMFINDNTDLDDFQGRVYVVDQKNEDGTFDEHKVMYGYPTWSQAKKAYERNYEPGWWDKHVMQMIGVKKADFDKWLGDSDHKTKPFADYYRTKILTDAIKDPSDQMMADVEERRKAAKRAAITPTWSEQELSKMDNERLSQLRKTAQKDLSTSRVLLGTTNIAKGSEKEDILKDNIARSEVNIKALDAEIQKRREQMQREIENLEAGGAMVEHLENMGIDVTDNISEMRKARKKAEKDNSKEGRIRKMTTSDGNVYGFAYRGKLYLDPRKLDANLPLHEYGHLWAEAFRRLNPDGWKDIVNVMKQDADTWKLIKSLNPDLTSDDDIAEEVIAKGSGDNGEERIRQEFERMSQRDPSYKGKWGNIWKNISKAIQDFWKKVGDFLHIKYENPKQVYDQVLKDFANGVNPRKKVEEYLRQRDDEYMKAVNDGDMEKATGIFNEALKENVGNGMTPYVTVDNYRKLQQLARKIKKGDPIAVNRAAVMMAPLIPENAVLVPVPAHEGKATDMLDLVNAIADITGSEVADVLVSAARKSQYETKKQGGKALSSDELGITVNGQLPEGKIPVVIDNVVDSGNTAEACIKALGTGIVASLADSTDKNTHAATLKSAAPVIEDKDGNIVPLSKRFDLGASKYLGKKATAAEKLLQEVGNRLEAAAEYKGEQEVQAAIESDEAEKELTAAEQKLRQPATKAVIKVIGDAGVPIRQVSQQEADDMLTLYTALNQQAITDFARQQRDNDRKRYAVINVRDPYAVPKYFEKKSYAEEYRVWGNRAGGLFKTIDLGSDKQTTVEKLKNAANIMPEINVWHGSGAVFTKFDHSHMNEGAGSQTFGWGTYLTTGREVAEGYAHKGEIIKKYNNVIVDPDPYSDNAADRALFYVQQEHGVDNAIKFIKSLIKEEDDESIINDYKEVIKALQDKENWSDGDKVLYKVEIPDDTGKNYLDWYEKVDGRTTNSIANDLYKLLIYNDKDEMYDGEQTKKQLRSDISDSFEIDNVTGSSLYGNLSVFLGGDKEASDFLADHGFVGVKYPAGTIMGGGNGATNYVIFNEDNAKIVDHIQFMFDNGEEYTPTFYSNAMRAVEGIKQEKATPEQWLKMIEKSGGLKAGEDKWIGLSDWLKQQQSDGKKSVTKQEVEDYIRQNQIQVADKHYKEYFDVDSNPQMIKFREEFSELVEKYEDEMKAVNDEQEAVNQEMYDKYGKGWAADIDKLDKEDRDRLEDMSMRYKKFHNEDLRELAFQEMVKKYGDDFGMAFEVNYGNGELDPTMEPGMYYDDDMSEAAKLFLATEDNPINKTRLSYTTEGLDNKREIALVVPTIEPYREDDSIHFGDAGGGRAVAWVRFGETTDADGNKVLVIDEIQSKRHQDAREKGYKNAEAEKLQQELNDLKAERSKVDKRQREVYEEIAASDEVKALLDKDGLIREDATKQYDKIIEENAELAELNRRWRDLTDKIQEKINDLYASREGVPEAPFEKNWHELAMKRMLRFAAENGYDYVAWTKGDQQAERYDIGGAVPYIDVKTNPDGDFYRDLRFSANGNDCRVAADENGKITLAEGLGDEAVGKSLGEVFGKEVAIEIMGSDGEKRIQLEGKRIGGEGMKGFYDQILPRFMDKYGKKWGVKTGEIDLPDLEKSAQKMWSVPVTPEMKESVMQGQPMFQKEGTGKIYGWTDGTGIFLTPLGMNPNSPMHEYTHIWDKYIQKHDPKLWKEMVETFKKTAMWKQIRENENYRSIWNDDNRMASEVHSRLTGARSEEEFTKAAAGGAKDAESIIKQVKDVLRRFWEKIASLFGYGKDRLEEFVLMPLKDVLNGFNPITGDNSFDPMAMIVQMSRPNKYGLNENDPRGKAVNEVKKQGGNGVLAGYADEKTGEYVLLGEDAKRMQSMGGKGVMTKENGMDGLRMTARQFDDVSPVIVHRGYRIAIADMTAPEEQPRKSTPKEKPQDSARLRKLMQSKKDRDADYLQILINQQKDYIVQLQKQMPQEQKLYDAWQKAIGTKDEDTARSRYDKYYDNHEADIRLLDSARLQLDDLEKELAEKQEKTPAAKVKLKVDKKPPVQSLIQGELFSDKDFEPLPEPKEEPKAKNETVQKKAKGIDDMSDTDLLKGIGEKEGTKRREYIDMYDQRHLQEQNEENDAYYDMLDANNTSLEDAYSMYDSVFRQFKEGGYASRERTKLLAQIDALEAYIEWQEDREAERKMEEEETAEAIEQTSLPDEAKQKFEQQQEEVRQSGYDLTKLRLRPLQKGETSHVERRYVENGMFSFTGGEHIKSVYDIAYIFRELENASVENTFLTLVKDGQPTIIHLAIGGYSASYAPHDVALAAYQEIDPEMVFFVHNHPSGNVKASKQDEDIMRGLRNVFGKKLQDGIIIDTKSGKFGIFNEKSQMDKGTRPTSAENEVPLKVYSFSKQVFDEDWNPETAFKAITSKDVASFISSHRLGEHPKMSLIVTDQAGHVTGNIFLPFTTLKEAAESENIDLIAKYVEQMGGNRCILYGNYDYEMDDARRINYLNEKLKSRLIRLADLVHIDHSAAEAQLIGEPDTEMTVASEPVKDSETTKIFDAAKKPFGTTYDIREAGYVLPDGTMPDFSGRHLLDPGTDSSFLRGRRTTDHREVQSLAYDKDGNTKTGIETDMPDFIRRGAIRIDDISGTINLATKPTDKQKAILRQLIAHNDGYVQVDFGDGWDSDHYVEYDGAKPARVLSDIDKYFDESVKPQGDYGVMRSRKKSKTRKVTLGNIQEAENVIDKWLKEDRRDQSFEIELPQSTLDKINKVMGQDYDSHNISINDIIHANKEHGEKGKKLKQNDIPLSGDALKLIPYIMVAPDKVAKGSTDIRNRESIRFIKNLGNGVVIVVEKEKINNPQEMQTATMWANMSSRVADARTNASPALDARNVITSFDAAKIRKDAETAIENDKKMREEQQNRIKIAADETADMLGGVKVNYATGDEIANEKLKRENDNGTLGTYDPNTGEVTLFLDNIEDVTEAKRTVCHEKLGHEGLVALLGDQAEVDKFGQFIFKSADKSLRQRIIDKAGENDPAWKDNKRFTHAAQEVFADIAADGPRTAEEFSLWNKVKHYLIRLLNKLGLRIRGLLNDHDLRYYVLKTGEALKRWNQLSPEEQAAAARQETDYDLMRSRRGKPRKRRDESMAQYLQRLRDWERWKIAEEQAAANNDPMPEAEAINEKWHEKYNADIAEWKRQNNIDDDAQGLGEFPKRDSGESPQEYAARVADYETQKDAWRNAPSLFDYLNRANEEYKTAYREWKERYGIREAESVDLGLYEGDPDSLPHIVDPEDLEADTRAEADLAEAVGIDMSSEGAKRHTKLSLIERRKNLESANAEDAIWIHNLVKQINEEAKRQRVEPKELREAMADIIEGTYFEEVIRDEDGNMISIEDVTDSVPIKMTDGLRDILDTIKDWYDYFFHEIEDAGLRNDAGYIEEGYVNHVWSKEKSSPEAWKKYVENFQRTKSPNMRERLFKTYRDGRDVGLVPKFKDIADILAYYSASNNEAIANRKFLDALSFIVVEEKNSDGEVVSVLPLLNSNKPNIAVSDRYKMYQVPGVGDVYVLKDIQRTFANVFGTMRTQDIPEWLTKVGNVYDVTSSTAKKIELSFSAFHMGALTEVAMAQMRPDRALKALGQYIILDCAKAGTVPAYAHPEDFKLAASHLVQLGATQDYSAADVNNVTEKIREMVRQLADSEQVVKKGAGFAATPVAAALDYVNKGMDKVLWNYLHDGLKIACFKMFAEQIEKRVEKQGLSAEQREQLLDEAGQYVNDTFGGQYWELLNVSPALIKWLRRALLSPDWLISTQRHFLANFGFGSIYSESGFMNYIQYNIDNLKRGAGMVGKAIGIDNAWANIDTDENRRFRSRNAKICYLIGVLGYFYILINAINNFFRSLDVEKEKEKADEIRKTNPDYKSPYELAYPDGMKWYDYTMYGNTIGQQTHLFLGRYDDGTEWYARWGKQFREFPELFMGRHGVEFPTPLMERMSGKANPIGRYLLYDLPLTVGMYGYKQPRETQEIAEKYGNTVALLAMTAKKFLPYSVPTQQDKEFKMFDLVMPSQKGFTRWKAVDYFKTYIQGGDMDGVMRTYNAAVMNGIDAEDCLKAAIATVKATQRKELEGGVIDLQSAMDAYDAAKNVAEKKRLRQKIFGYLAEQNYKTFTQDEAREQVQGFLSGEQPIDNDVNKYVELATSADVRDEYRIDFVRKQAKKYVDEVKTAEGDRQRKLEDTYGAWMDIYDIIQKANREINKLKRQLGKEGTDDAATMQEIRDIRREAQKDIDQVKAP